MTHTLVQVIIRGRGIPGDGDWDVGNVLRVFEIEDDPSGGYLIHVHRDEGHWQRRDEHPQGRGKWTPGPDPSDRSTSAGWVKVMGTAEIKDNAFYVIRSTHPDDVSHLEGRGIIEINMKVMHVSELGVWDQIMNREIPSPMVENRLTKAALLSAKHGPNYGLTDDEIEERKRAERG